MHVNTLFFYLFFLSYFKDSSCSERELTRDTGLIIIIDFFSSLFLPKRFVRDSYAFVELEEDGYFYEWAMLSSYRANAPLSRHFEMRTPDVFL